ncbi:MAG: rod shape-determining protein RodA [Betaproteobacteria bacterium]|nr:rod shape-determining protein RodA [Betaproteobacteria bacterium]
MSKILNEFIKRIDGPLFSISFLLIILGLITLAGSNLETSTIIVNQVFNISVGLIIFTLVIFTNPRILFGYAPILFFLTIFLLVLVHFFGIESNGAKRWLAFGGLNLQPSELIKITLPLMIAWLYQNFQNKISLKVHLIAIFLILVPVYLVLLQPDLGTSIMIALSGFLIIFLAGVSWRLILSSLVITILSSPIIWMNLHIYQKNRILNMLDPFADPLGTGYHTIQSMIAIGSGGGFGKGWGQGSQTNLNFLPEANTDFIFAVYAEEFGFFGVILIFALFLFLIYRIFNLANDMQDTFSKLLTVSLGASIFAAIFVNIAMISGLVPVVGLPLPFMSYGGTSMVVSLISIGIIMNLNNHKTLIAN